MKGKRREEKEKEKEKEKEEGGRGMNEWGEWGNVIDNQDILYSICVCMGLVCTNFGLKSDHMISPLHTKIFDKIGKLQSI